MTSHIATGRAHLTPSRPAPARSLPRRVRQVLLVVHILAAGIWIGVDVIVAVLVLAGRFSADPDTRLLAGEALVTFVFWPMLAAGLGTLISGIALGVGTKWGLLRYRWVAVKLGLNVLLCLATVVALRPALDLLRTDPGAMPDDLFFPPAVSLVSLSLATALAVMKPWGRLRRASARPSGAAGRTG